jgi:hypothetical protein
MLNEQTILSLHNQLIDELETLDEYLVNGDFINSELTNTFVDELIEQIKNLGDNK